MARLAHHTANRLCASSDTSLFIPKPIDYIRTAYPVMPDQSDGDPLDQDLHSEPPSPLISSSRGDGASESYAPQTAPSSTENLYVCPPIDVPPTMIPYHLQYSVPESFPAPLSDSSAPTLFSPYSAFLGDQMALHVILNLVYIPSRRPYLPHFLCTFTIPQCHIHTHPIHYLCHKLP